MTNVNPVVAGADSQQPPAASRPCGGARLAYKMKSAPASKGEAEDGKQHKREVEDCVDKV